MRVLLASAVTALIATPALKVDTQEWTYGLASAGGSVWVGGLALGDVVRIDPASGKVTKRINIGARVFNLASAPGAVWAVANLSSTVSRIDARTGRVTATVRVGNGPYDVEWGFGSAWVSNSSDGTVSRITGKKVVKTIKVGVEPNGLSAIGDFLWVTDHTAGKLLRVDPRTNKVTGSVDVAGADWVTKAGRVALGLAGDEPRRARRSGRVEGDARPSRSSAIRSARRSCAGSCGCRASTPA